MTKYTKEILESLILESFSFTEVIKKLGLKQNGGNLCYIKKRTIALNIDFSHFRKMYIETDKKKKQWQDILIKGKEVRTVQRNRFLIESGRKYECEKCYNKGVWEGTKLVLQVDHKNGDILDNRPENLRFLCPNCHSQTENFAGKSLKRLKKEYLCPECKEIISKYGYRCKKCAGRLNGRIYETKIQWPHIEELQEMVKNSTFVAVAKKLGVSDRAIRKHLQKYGVVV